MIRSRPSRLATLCVGLVVGLTSCTSLQHARDLQRAALLSDEVRQHTQRAEYAQALPKARKALAIREDIRGPSHPDVATSLLQLADILRRQGDYAAARPLYERALAASERALGRDHLDVTTVLNNYALLLEITGEYDKARPLLERALELRERMLGPLHPWVAISLNNLGLLHQTLGNHAIARPLYERALRIREHSFGPSHPDVALILSNLGRLHHAVGGYETARTLHTRALRIREQALGSGHPEVADSLNSLGVVLRQTGDFAGARQRLERAVRIWEDALGPTHASVAAGLNNLARTLEATGDVARARLLYERALQSRERALGENHPELAYMLSNLARTSHAAGDTARARALYERALAIRSSTLGSDHHLVALSLNNLADHLWETGEAAVARALYERARDIARTTGAAESRWRAAFGLGSLYEAAGRLPEALALYQEAVQTLEGLSGQFAEAALGKRFLQVDNRFAAYDALARIQLRLHEHDRPQGYDRDAWAVLEAKRARLAAEILAAARPAVHDARIRKEVERVQATQERAQALEQALQEERDEPPAAQRRERIENLTTLLAQTKAEYLAQVKALLGRHPEYKAQFVDQQTVDPKILAKFADRLPPDTLAVQYFPTPDTLYVFVVARGGRLQVMRRLVSQRDLYDLVTRYRMLVEAGEQAVLPWSDDGSDVYRRAVAPLKTVTRALSSHLLGPIEAELQSYPHLVLFPNDFLLYLPIHALIRERPDGSARFLAETHAVSYATQLEMVDVLIPEPLSDGAPLLAMANPDGTLPGASREVRALSRVRPRMTVLDGPRATKARLLTLLADFSDLHMATHGVLDPTQPERSYLLLAGPDVTSQRLTLGEIAGLRLPGGLAILSACETALGERTPGAALITLAAAFSQAGARSIVASLWKVNDDATGDFMVTFHAAMRDRSRASALQQAQVSLIGSPRTAHPFYWAPFVLIGAR